MTRIRLVREIGEGGAGQVLEGRVQASEGPGVPVAVKFMRASRFEEKRFAREAETAFALSHKHPGLLRTFWFGVKANTQPYLVLELVAGSIGRLRGSGPLGARFVRKIARDVLSALAFLHEHDIVHRDVSNGNIMVSRDGRVLLGDFGLVRDRNGSVSGRIEGTPACIPPEVFEGRPHTAASDAYALGVVLYYLVLGEAPYGDGRLADVYRAIVLGNAPSPLPDDLPSDLTEVITGLMRLSPGERLTVTDALAILESSAEETASAKEFGALVVERFPEPDQGTTDESSLAALRDAVLQADIEFDFGKASPNEVQHRPSLAWLPWFMMCLVLVFTVYRLAMMHSPEQAKSVIHVPSDETSSNQGDRTSKSAHAEHARDTFGEYRFDDQ